MSIKRKEINKIKKEDIEFIKLIRTRPGGYMRIEGQYKVFFEKEVVLLHLQIVKEGLIEDFPEIREARPAETRDNFIRNKEDQEEFFRGKGKEIIIKTLTRVKGIEGIKRLGCGQIPNKYVSRFKFRTIIIKDIKNLTAEE